MYMLQSWRFAQKYTLIESQESDKRSLGHRPAEAKPLPINLVIFLTVIFTGGLFCTTNCPNISEVMRRKNIQSNKREWRRGERSTLKKIHFTDGCLSERQREARYYMLHSQSLWGETTVIPCQLLSVRLH